MQHPEEPEVPLSNSTSLSPSSQFQAMSDDFSQPVSSSAAPLVQRYSAKRLKEALNVSKQRAKTHVDHGNSEGFSARNDSLELRPSRPLPSREVEHGNSSGHFGISEIVGTCFDLDLNADEVESSAFVLILGKYPVKKELAPRIRSIIEKHGDIAAKCRDRSLEVRSIFLEQLAEFLGNMESKTIVQLSIGKIKTAMDIVSRFSNRGLDVGWLQRRLKDVLKTREMIWDYGTLKKDLKKAVQAAQEERQALEIAEAEVVLCQQRVIAADKQVEAIKNTISSAKVKVKHFVDHPPLHGL